MYLSYVLLIMRVCIAATLWKAAARRRFSSLSVNSVPSIVIL